MRYLMQYRDMSDQREYGQVIEADSHDSAITLFWEKVRKADKSYQLLEVSKVHEPKQALGS